MNEEINGEQPIEKPKSKYTNRGGHGGLRAQLIAQRREHLKLLGLQRRVKVKTLHELLTDDNPVNDNGKAEGMQ